MNRSMIFTKNTKVHDNKNHVSSIRSLKINNYRMKIGIIGYGSMGKMLLEKFIETKSVKESDIFLSTEKFEEIMNLNKIYPQINICKENTDTAKNADILFLCVKPLDITLVLSEVINNIKDNCHIISLAGYILFQQLEQICAKRKISKVMPSVTAEVYKSMTLICHNDYVKDEDKNRIEQLLECFGKNIRVTESELGMASDLTSSMPGFICAILKVITNEAEKHTSISRDRIVTMVTETMYGTGKLLVEKNITFDDLINRVATKGGITEEGTKVIDEKLPQVMNEMFEKTSQKIELTIEKIKKSIYL